MAILGSDPVCREDGYKIIIKLGINSRPKVNGIIVIKSGYVIDKSSVKETSNLINFNALKTVLKVSNENDAYINRPPSLVVIHTSKINICTGDTDIELRIEHTFGFTYDIQWTCEYNTDPVATELCNILLTPQSKFKKAPLYNGEEFGTVKRYKITHKSLNKAMKSSGLTKYATDAETKVTFGVSITNFLSLTRNRLFDIIFVNSNKYIPHIYPINPYFNITDETYTSLQIITRTPVIDNSIKECINSELNIIYEYDVFWYYTKISQDIIDSYDNIKDMFHDFSISKGSLLDNSGEPFTFILNLDQQTLSDYGIHIYTAIVCEVQDISCKYQTETRFIVSSFGGSFPDVVIKQPLRLSSKCSITIDASKSLSAKETIINKACPELEPLNRIKNLDDSDDNITKQPLICEWFCYQYTSLGSALLLHSNSEGFTRNGIQDISNARSQICVSDYSYIDSGFKIVSNASDCVLRLPPQSIKSGYLVFQANVKANHNSIEYITRFQRIIKSVSDEINISVFVYNLPDVISSHVELSFLVEILTLDSECTIWINKYERLFMRAYLKPKHVNNVMQDWVEIDVQPTFIDTLNLSENNNKLALTINRLSANPGDTYDAVLYISDRYDYLSFEKIFSGVDISNLQVQSFILKPDIFVDIPPKVATIVHDYDGLVPSPIFLTSPLSLSVIATSVRSYETNSLVSI